MKIKERLEGTRFDFVCRNLLELVEFRGYVVRIQNGNSIIKIAD